MPRSGRVANRVVGPLLASPVHHPLSFRLMLLRYTGRRTGRRYTIPVAYTWCGDGEVMATSDGPKWAVNLLGGQPVHLRIRGRWYHAKPTVVTGQAAVVEQLTELVRHRPRAGGALRIGLPRLRAPTSEELRRAAARVLVVRFRPTGPANP